MGWARNSDARDHLGVSQSRLELREAAREFHHMMLATDPKHVTLCLDAHWIYRGAGNSAVALFDVVQLYGRRVSELHIRQSVDNVWTETVCEGDIDYAALTRKLERWVCSPHLVLEQSVEKETPQHLGVVAAHQASKLRKGLRAGFSRLLVVRRKGWSTFSVIAWKAEGFRRTFVR